MRKNAKMYLVTGVLLTLGSVPSRADQSSISPPPSSALLLEAQADGVQIYVCEHMNSGEGWVFKEPSAELFDNEGRQIATHFAGPTWKLTDGSEVIGAPVAKADAPMSGAIPWLLLKVTARHGSGKLAAVSMIRRIDTKGGVAPATGCDANHLGDEARMRYSATYQFYGAAK
jgi:hypothetical protein